MLWFICIKTTERRGVIQGLTQGARICLLACDDGTQHGAVGNRPINTFSIFTILRCFRRKLQVVLVERETGKLVVDLYNERHVFI